MSTDPILPLHRFTSRRPPVVLLGGVNLVRAAGLAGIPAIVASANPEEPAFASRYCVARCHLPSFERPDAVAKALAELGHRLTSHLGRRVPLVYGGDAALEVIYSHRERLQRYFLFLVNEPRVAHALIAKDRFQKLAHARRLPVPAELHWEGDGPGTVKGTAAPVLVKPRNKADWHQSTLCQRLFAGDGKARIFASGAEAAAEPDVALFHEQLTFQRYIPGGDEDHWSYHGFADEHGEVRVSFVGRKLRTFPTVTGESAFIELAYEDSLSALGREIARTIPLRGVFKMDFKRDPGDGRWYLLEINARFNLWHYLGAVNGLNLVQVVYDFLVDGVIPGERAYGTRYRWLALGLDYKAYRELAARGELTAAAWLRSILTAPKVHNLFAWDDPGPWLHTWKARLARRLDRGSARFVLALRQWRSTAS